MYCSNYVLFASCMLPPDDCLLLCDDRCLDGEHFVNDPDHSFEQDQQYRQETSDQGKYSMGFIFITMIM